MNYDYQPTRRIDNIFSALVHERTPGAVMEFVLWCTTCLMVLLSLIVLIIGHGRISWIFMMIFAIGLGVISAFRLKPIALLYSVISFNLIVCILHFVNFFQRGSNHGSDWGYDFTYSVFNVVLFVIEIILVVTIVVLAFIHFFSTINLGNVMTILVCVDTGVTVILNILMYAVPYTGDYAEYMNDVGRDNMNYYSYWFGTVVLWMLLIEVLLYYVLFFWGAIDNRKGKIIPSLNQAGSQGGFYGSGPSRVKSVNVGIRGVSGVCAGQIYYLQGRTVTIGSDPRMMVVVQAPNVSRQHCAIRFNYQTGLYEIFDNSTNGVFLSSGGVLQKGVYNSVRRGDVIAIGNKEQRFALL